jgi:hypothetical protein
VRADPLEPPCFEHERRTEIPSHSNARCHTQSAPTDPTVSTLGQSYFADVGWC